MFVIFKLEEKPNNAKIYYYLTNWQSLINEFSTLTSYPYSLLLCFTMA